jgi:hypothetical protein
MTAHVASSIQTIQEFKQQNDHYWKIIEKQRLIIQTLQKTLANLSNENEYLLKRNKQLECSSFTAATVHRTPGFDSAHVTHHHPLAEISVETNNATTSAIAAPATVAEVAAVANTPVPPPRSPYRVNHHNQHEKPPVDLPKRPPVLKLAMSNHSSLYSRANNSTTTVVDRDYLISPGNRKNGNLSNPSSPLSTTSAGSSSLENRPSFETYSDNSSKYSTPCRSSISPNHQNEQEGYKSAKRGSANQYEPSGKNYLDVMEHNNSKSEPATPVPRTPRFDSLMTHEDSTFLSNLSNIHVSVISSSIGNDKKGKEAPVFIIGIQQNDDLKNEIWRIEKSLTDILHLDTNVRICICGNVIERGTKFYFSLEMV